MNLTAVNYPYNEFNGNQFTSNQTQAFPMGINAKRTQRVCRILNSACL